MQFQGFNWFFKPCLESSVELTRGTTRFGRCSRPAQQDLINGHVGAGVTATLTPLAVCDARKQTALALANLGFCGAVEVAYRRLAEQRRYQSGTHRRGTLPTTNLCERSQAAGLPGGLCRQKSNLLSRARLRHCKLCNMAKAHKRQSPQAHKSHAPTLSNPLSQAQPYSWEPLCSGRRSG